LSRLERKKLISYARLFGREGLNKLVKDVLEMKPS